MSKNTKRFEERPWGTFEIIHEFAHASGTGESVIKKIVVHPQRRLSLQSHTKRKEHWLIVEGEGIVVLDDEEIMVGPESKIEVKVGTKHRISNTHSEKPLIFIEVSFGEFDENDIVRFQDDFGR